jgi:hypothetical protein
MSDASRSKASGFIPFFSFAGIAFQSFRAWGKFALNAKMAGSFRSLFMGKIKEFKTLADHYNHGVALYQA